MISNAHVEILVEKDKEDIFSDKGYTSWKAIFETDFILPRYNVREDTVTVIAEDENAKSSKILQMFNLIPELKSRYD